MTEDQFKTIKADDIQKQIIAEFAEIISKEIPVTKMAVKGYLWRSLRKWQKKHEMDLIDTETGEGSSPDERIKQAKEILEIFESQVNKTFKDDSAALHTGIINALDHYKKNYAYR